MKMSAYCLSSLVSRLLSSTNTVQNYVRTSILLSLLVLLETLKSDFKCASLIPKSLQFRYWIRKHNTLQQHTLIINTFRGPIYIHTFHTTPFIMTNYNVGKLINEHKCTIYFSVTFKIYNSKQVCVLLIEIINVTSNCRNILSCNLVVVAPGIHL